MSRASPATQKTQPSQPSQAAELPVVATAAKTAAKPARKAAKAVQAPVPAPKPAPESVAAPAAAPLPTAAEPPAAPEAPAAPPEAQTPTRPRAPRRPRAKAASAVVLASDLPKTLVADTLAVLQAPPEQPAPPVLPAPAIASPPAAAPPTSAAKPTEIAGLQPLLSLGVAEGLFLIAAAGAKFEAVQAFARYEAEPLPRFISSAQGYFNAQASQAGPVVYTAFVPWPGVPTGALQLGCITASARKPLLTVNSLALADLKPEALAALLARFGRILLPAVLAVLPPAHALRQVLQPELPKPVVVQPAPPQAALRCCFDGAIDGLAHGWVYDPAQPGKAFMVEVLHQGEVVARGLADRYRDDLERNGMGDGCHHFRLALSYALFDGQPHLLSVRVPDLGAAELCPPLTCTLEATQPAHLDAMPRAQTLVLAQQLGRNAAVRNAKAEQALMQAFRQCCLQQETWLLEEARAGYVKLAEILGANALCHCKIAETWLLDHQLARALEAYSAAVKADPLLAWAQLGLGNVLRLQGQPLAAQAAYRSALAIDPENAAVRRRLDSVEADAVLAQARQMLDQGDKSGATALLKAIVMERPNDVAACNQLDELLLEAESVAADAWPPLPDVVLQADRSRRLLDATLDEAKRRLQARQGGRPD